MPDTVIVVYFQEVSETRLAVQEALSMMSTSFRQIDDTNLQLLEALLMQNIDKVRMSPASVGVGCAHSRPSSCRTSIRSA